MIFETYVSYFSINDMFVYLLYIYIYLNDDIYEKKKSKKNIHILSSCKVKLLQLI